jgi:CRISPR-associated endoribonuclease Cas6
MGDLLSVMLCLRPSHTDTVPAWLGRAAHAWFLDALRQIQPDLSAAVHDASGPKPFTVSSLLTETRGDLLQLMPRRTYPLRLTTLHPDVTKLVMSALIPHWLETSVQLHSQHFRVEQVVVDPALDSRTGKTTYADLLAQPPQPGRMIKLIFSSPTAFHKTGEINYPLPSPELVFGSLQDRWNRFSPVPLPADVKATALASLEIDTYTLRTRRISFERAGRGVFTGFVGEVTYRLTTGDALLKQAVSALARYALYAGVGVRTTMGLGQARAMLSAPQQVSGD